ncbi:MAG: ATP-binding cassette domain-containing protein [Spiroplasma sp.]|nr:ATP-binding cassette domain-containing protein [Mycoplasmatales bacterium]
MAKKLVEVKNLKKYFHVSSGTLHAVDDISFHIEEGTTLGIVGESGCGKSTTGRLLLRLLEPTDGDVYFDGELIKDKSKKEMIKLREEMQIVFQDPYASLNPKKTVAQIIKEPLILHKVCKNKEELEQRVDELMAKVKLTHIVKNS